MKFSETQFFSSTQNGAGKIRLTDKFPGLLIIPENMNTRYIHPGKILRDEYFAKLGISQIDAAKATGIPQSRLSEILSGRRSITADTAYRLGKFFGVEPQGFVNLQAHYDLALVAEKMRNETPRRQIEVYTKFVAHAV